MEMIEMTLNYLNKLASQILTMSSLLGGFSITIAANFLISDLNTKYSNRVFKVSVLAACFFIISILASAGIVMKTTEGYPFPLKNSDFSLIRTISGLSFLFGILSLIFMIGMSGWIKSKKLGIYTTIIGVLTFILILIMITT